MRQAALIGLLTVGLAACASSGTGSSVMEHNGTEAKRVAAVRGGDVDPADSERICKSTPITGSRAAKRVCHTRAEWTAMRRNAEDTVRGTQQKPTYHWDPRTSGTWGPSPSDYNGGG